MKHKHVYAIWSTRFEKFVKYEDNGDYGNYTPIFSEAVLVNTDLDGFNVIDGNRDEFVIQVY